MMPGCGDAADPSARCRRARPIAGHRQEQVPASLSGYADDRAGRLQLRLRWAAGGFLTYATRLSMADLRLVAPCLTSHPGAAAEAPVSTVELPSRTADRECV
jgi:hypothetical protein